MASHSTKRPKYKISSEYSAQRMSHPPNPALARALTWMFPDGTDRSKVRIADLGCGKLRHFAILSKIARELFLVDTQEQLNWKHVDGTNEYTVVDFAKQATRSGQRAIAYPFSQFSKSRLKLDAVFCIAVFDVVARQTRQALILAAARNLKRYDTFCVIVPRNDLSILRRCTDENRYLDGHIFHHHGVTTFFSNFPSIRTIKNDCQDNGLKLTADLSTYRQVCLAFTNSAR